MKQFNTIGWSNQTDGCGGGDEDEDEDENSLSTQCVSGNMLRVLHRSFNLPNSYQSSTLWIIMEAKLQITPLLSSCWPWASCFTWLTLSFLIYKWR